MNIDWYEYFNEIVKLQTINFVEKLVFKVPTEPNNYSLLMGRIHAIKSCFELDIMNN